MRWRERARRRRRLRRCKSTRSEKIAKRYEWQQANRQQKTQSYTLQRTGNLSQAFAHSPRLFASNIARSSAAAKARRDCQLTVTVRKTLLQSLQAALADLRPSHKLLKSASSKLTKLVQPFLTTFLPQKQTRPNPKRQTIPLIILMNACIGMSEDSRRKQDDISSS